jgi:hypothetical protein
MEAHTLRLDTQPALKTPEIRRTCCAVEAILRAGDILDTEPPAVLEEIRDYCTAYNKGRKGTFSAFKHVDRPRGRTSRRRATTQQRLYGSLTGERDAAHDRW